MKKLSKILISLLLFLVLLKSEKVHEDKSMKNTAINIMGHIPSRQKSYPVSDIATSYNIIQNEQCEKSIEAPKSDNLNLYDLATFAFNLENYLGKYCDRCKSLEYFAFKVGDYYLTAKKNHLQLQTASSGSPLSDQLFIGYQQIDGTWALKSLSQGKYIKADNDKKTISYQKTIGPKTRWYIERHGSIHIQSAQFMHNWWGFKGAKLQQTNGQAAPFKVQYWPKLQWLWNW